MSSVAHIPSPIATLDEDAWDDLLNYIEERRVIPIIGPELLKVDTETGPRLLYDWVAERLAVKLGVDLIELRAWQPPGSRRPADRQSRLRRR